MRFSPRSSHYNYKIRSSFVIPKNDMHDNLMLYMSYLNNLEKSLTSAELENGSLRMEVPSDCIQQVFLLEPNFEINNYDLCS